MKIGIVVDGVAEYESLPALMAKVAAGSGHTYHVIKADIQPFAPIGAIARSCVQPVAQLAARRMDIVLILFDRETRADCPGDLATSVVEAINLHRPCSVVIKDKTFENWLIADLAAFRAHRARFTVAPRHRRRVEPNMADQANGLEVIKDIVNGTYDKVGDARLILRAGDPLSIARHSRSFRKFLREAGHPAYAAQSRRPA